MSTNPKHQTPNDSEAVFSAEEPISAAEVVPPPPPTAALEPVADQELPANYGAAPRAKPFAFLYVERGPGMGQLLEVKQTFVVVGRASVSDLRLLHPSISRRHAQVRRDGQRYFVKDLGSQNGTFVNKQRIATEVEIKPGDAIALGNALLRLRGPLTRGEKAIKTPAAALPRAGATTGVISRAVPPTAVPAAPTSNTALKVAVFVGAVGFSLAGVLAIALMKTLSNGKAPEATTVTVTPGASRTDQAKLIDDAITRAMSERQAAARAAPAAPTTPEDVPVEVGEVVASKPSAPSAKAAPPQPVAVKTAAAPAALPASIKAPTVAAPKKTAPPAKEVANEEEDSAVKPGATGKRTQILAAYEKGNAEASLSAAQAAGDKELTDKLSRFLASYEAANEALMSNNGSAAIAHFQKALLIDEGLSSGWGKYGAEIRRQLSNLYVLVGLQFVANGDVEKAKAAFQGALKHQPSNPRAQEQLAKLTASAPVAAEKEKPSAKSIDDAFDN